jgi:hypothetical protein
MGQADLSDPDQVIVQVKHLKVSLQMLSWIIIVKVKVRPTE